MTPVELDSHFWLRSQVIPESKKIDARLDFSLKMREEGYFLSLYGVYWTFSMMWRKMCFVSKVRRLDRAVNTFFFQSPLLVIAVLVWELVPLLFEMLMLE